MSSALSLAEERVGRCRLFLLSGLGCVTRLGREGGGFGEIGLVSVLRDAEAFGGAVRTRGIWALRLGSPKAV
jgi:hypothetical protein